MIHGPDDNVYVEGAKHYRRFHGKTTYDALTQLALYVGSLVIIAFLCWGAVHLLVALPHPNPSPPKTGYVYHQPNLPTYSQYEKQHP